MREKLDVLVVLSEASTTQVLAPIGITQLVGTVRVPETGATPTVMVTDWVVENCPLPAHWRVKLVSTVRGLVEVLPDSDALFDHGPPAVQLVAFVELQVSVARPL